MQRHISARVRRVLVVLIAAAAPVMLGRFTRPAPTFDDRARRAVIARVLDAVQARYLSPDTARAIVARVEARLVHGDYDRLTTRGELADALTSDLQAVSHDAQLRVRTRAGTANAVAVAVARVMEAGDGLTKVEILAGNVGYLRVNAFAEIGAVANHLARAIRTLANTDALIIDLRGSHGGSMASAMFLAGFLVEHSTTVARLVSRSAADTTWLATARVPGPLYLDRAVYVLIDRETCATAESVAYHLQALGRAIVVGDTTRGRARSTDRVDVDGGFTVTVPIARSISVFTQRDWEGVGVIPDVAIAPTSALTRAQVLALVRLPRTRERDRALRVLEGQ